MLHFDKVEDGDKTNNTEQPVVVLKPSANETREGNIYLIGRELFHPTPESVNKLLDLLNEFKTDIQTNIATIAEKFFEDVHLKKIKNISLSESEKMALDNGCNILGGTFLSYINSFGVEIGIPHKNFNISSDDIEFLETLYPDLAIFFASPEKLTENEINFKTGVIYNNTGSFKVVEVEKQTRIFSPEILKELAVLKRIYRHFAKETIPFEKVRVRCNLIHTPETLDELKQHEILYQKRIRK